MTDLTSRPGPGGDPMQKNPEDNQAQASSDATADEGSNRLDADFTEQSDRAHGQGSDANGLSQFDEADGEKRKRLYKESGSPIISRMD